LGEADFGFDRPGVKVRGSDDGTDQRPVGGIPFDPKLMHQLVASSLPLLLGRRA
jgi:hypothetical protein